MVGILTGMLTELVIIFTLVCFHELGHYACARIFKWKIERIFLWVFGGTMETDEAFRRPIREELLVTLAGPLQHIFVFIFLYFLPVDFFPETVFQLIYQYNWAILLGNLLPIWPLDGGKLLKLALDYAVPFRKAHYWMIFLSVFVLLGGIVYCVMSDFTNLSIFLLFGFLLMENRLEWKRRYYRWFRFLWYRWTEPRTYRKTQWITFHDDDKVKYVLQSFYRNRNHMIVVEKKDLAYPVTEHDFLGLYMKGKYLTDVTARRNRM